MSEAERKPARGDRVVYRAENGEDYFGAIDALSPAGSATLALDNGQRVSGVEESNAPGGALFLNSWRLVEVSKALPEGSEPGLWLDALCAGLVVVAIDAADGRFPLARSGVQEALESFRRGVSLVLDLGQQ